MDKAVVSTAIVLVIAISTGCRSAQRFGSMVRVTEDPHANVADVPAPEQRLATTKTTAPESDELPKSGLSSALAGMPKVFQQDRAAESGAPQTKAGSASMKSSAAVQTRLASSGTKANAVTQGASMSMSDKTAPQSRSTTVKTAAATKSATAAKPASAAIASTGKTQPGKTEPGKTSPAKTVPSSNTASRASQSGDQPTDQLAKQVLPAASGNVSTEAVSGSISDLPPVSVRVPESMPIEMKTSELVQRTTVSEKTSAGVSERPEVGGLVATSMTDMTEKPDMRSVKPIEKQDAAPQTPNTKLVAKSQVTEEQKAAPAKTTQDQSPSQDQSPTQSTSDLVSVSEENPLSNSVAEEAQLDELPAVEGNPMPRTSHPNSLAEVLQSHLIDMPKLPKAKSKEDSPAPRRIGSPATVPATAMHVGDIQPTDSKRQDETLGDILNANQVRPVSHHLSGRESGKIAQTIASESAPMSQSSRDTPRDLSEKELFEKLLAKVSKPANDETPVQRERRLIMARHLMVLAGDPSAATEQMDGLNETEQRYLKNQLIGLWTMIDPEGHPSSGRRITEALPKFQEATRYMAAATDSLRLKHLEFCTEIESYGQIKPFEGNRFVAGQQVIVYCEVENFASAKTGELFQTKLQGNYDIYDSTGTKVISQLLPVDQQKSRNHLRDYYVAYQLNLPRQLTTGTYRMQLTIEDAVGKKYGQAEVPFEIK